MEIRTLPHFKLFLVICAIYTVQLPALSQAITFEEAVDRALQENITLKTQKNQLEVVEMEKARSRAQFAPSVNGFMQVRQQNGNVFIPQQLELVNTTTEDFFPQISANLTLFNGFRNMNGLKNANYNFTAQEKLVERAEQDIIARVAQQYMTVLLDKELVKIAQENLDAQETLQKRIKGFVEAGITFIGDQYNQEAQIKSMELAKVQALNQMKNDKALLAQTMLLDPLSKFEVVEPDWSLNDQMIQAYDLKTLYETAIAKRPDLQQLRDIRSASELQVQMAKAAYFPTLSAFFNYDSYYNSTARGADNEKVSFSQQLTEINPTRTIGMTLRIPIFNRLDNKTEVVRAKVNKENALLNIKDLENTVYTEVLTALQNYEAAVATFEASQAQYDATKVAMETQEERYKLGNATIVDVTTARNNFIQASVDQAQARYTLLFQKILLDYSTGELTPEALPGN